MKETTDRELYLKYIDAAIKFSMMNKWCGNSLRTKHLIFAARVLASVRNVMASPAEVTIQHRTTVMKLMIPESEKRRSILTEALNNMPPGAYVTLPAGMGFKLEIKTDMGNICLDNLKED